jgi:hypothetical protein
VRHAQEHEDGGNVGDLVDRMGHDRGSRIQDDGDAHHPPDGGNAPALHVFAGPVAAPAMHRDPDNWIAKPLAMMMGQTQYERGRK